MAECPDCHSIEIFEWPRKGNGVCSHCYGDGRSTMSGLNEKIAGCRLDCIYCDGTGICQTCDGTGRINDDEEDSHSQTKTEASTESDSSCGSGNDSSGYSGDYSSYSGSGSSSGGFGIVGKVLFGLVLLFLIGMCGHLTDNRSNAPAQRQQVVKEEARPAKKARKAKKAQRAVNESEAYRTTENIAPKVEAPDNSVGYSAEKLTNTEQTQQDLSLPISKPQQQPVPTINQFHIPVDNSWDNVRQFGGNILLPDRTSFRANIRQSFRNGNTITVITNEYYPMGTTINIFPIDYHPAQPRIMFRGRF